MCLTAGIMLKNISVRESHAIVIRNLGRLTFSRKTLANVLKSTRKTNTSPITLKQASWGNQGNLAHQTPRWNMHKLFDCISTPLKRFLACLTFHREEMRLRHLHKRTNIGSAPDSTLFQTSNNTDIFRELLANNFIYFSGVYNKQYWEFVPN